MALYTLFVIENPDRKTPPIPGAAPSGPDYIEIYWDSSTSTIVNSFNSNLNTYTGPNIGALSEFYFCVGTELSQFRLIANKPFAERLQFPNAPECSIVPDVCDAYIENPLILRPAAAGLNNGSVTVRGYTTKPSKVVLGDTVTTLYSLDNGFTWQPSPTFNNLAPGTYTVLMQDVADCTDSREFTIEAPAPYAVRFTTTYKDSAGQTTRIDVLKRSYDGLPEEVQAADNPLIIKEIANDLFTEIRGQECSISFLAQQEFHYLELFTGDDREFKVEVWKETTLFWSGWVVPDVYQEPYLAPPFAVSFSATDGLGELKNISFTEMPPEGFMSQWDVLLHILLKLDAFLPVHSGVNLYETRMNKQPYDEPFKQAFVSLDAYREDLDVFDCAAVLTAILKSYGAFIRQYRGAWQILRVEELKGSFPIRYYDTQGNLQSHEVISLNKLITGPRGAAPADLLFWVERSQALEMRPAFRERTVHVDFGLRDNMIRGGEMDATAFDSGWNHKYIDGPAGYAVEMVEPKAKTFALHLGAVDFFQNASYVETERVWINADPGLSLFFEFEYKVSAALSLTPDDVLPPEFIFSIHLNDKTLNFPIPPSPDNALEWRVNPNRFGVPTTSFHTWQKAELFVPNIPEDGWLKIRVYELADNGYEFAGLRVKRIAAIPGRSVSPALAEDETYIAVNSRKQNYAPATIEATHGDVLPLRNATVMYRNLITVNGTLDPSLDWQRNGKAEATPILQLLADTMLSLNETPVKLLRGSLRGSFNWNGVIQEPEVLTRYMPIGFEYNDKYNTISSEFMELLGTTQPRPDKRLLLETEAPFLMETGTYIGME